MAIEGKTSPLVTVKNHDDWPHKILFAYDGISLGKIMEHLMAFYNQNPHIPFNRRPNGSCHSMVGVPK